MKLFRRLALFLALAAVTAGVAFSQVSTNNFANSGGNLRELTLQQLSEIEIYTVSKEPEQVRKTPAAIFVITQEDIRRSGATSIPEILRLAPGVEVSRIDGGHWSVGIRGLQGQFSRAVLVMVDGRSVYTPLFAGVYWDVQDTSLDDIERIEVIRGPGATIWGANAFQGVVNIITRNSKDTHGTLATLSAGGTDRFTSGVRIGGGNGSSLDYRAYGKAFGRGPQYHQNNQQFDDWKMGQFGFRTDWSPSGKTTTTLQGDIYRGTVGEEVDIAAFTPPSETTVYGDDKVSGGNLRGLWKRDLASAGGIQVQGYFDRTSRIAPHYKEIRNTFDLDFLHHFKVPGSQSISWGLGARWSPGRFVPLVPTLDFTPNALTSSLYSGFAQDEIGIVPERLSLILGAKLEHNDYTGLEVQPSARLVWTPDSRQTFWAAVTKAVRTPSRLDRDLDLKAFLIATPLIYLQVAGNPNFASERLTGYEAGYRNLISPRLHVDVSAFFNHYNDLASMSSGVISSQTVPVPYTEFSIHYVNGVMGDTNGYEIAPVWKALDWLEFQGSYSHLQMNLRNQPGYSDASTIASLEGSSAHHRGMIQTHIKLPANLEYDQTLRYVSALPAQKVAAYETADARLSWRASESLQFSVVGQNLLQSQHVEFGHNTQQSVGIARTAYAKMTWTK